MFRQKDLASLDPSCFNIITAAPYDVTVISKNTGHVWLSIIRSIRSWGAASFFISIKFLTRIINIAELGACGRRSGESKDMTDGR